MSGSGTSGFHWHTPSLGVYSLQLHTRRYVSGHSVRMFPGRFLLRQEDPHACDWHDP